MPGEPLTGIYEPLYLPGQELVASRFLPLIVEENAYAAWRELRLLIDMYRDGVHRRHRFTGLLSPKFEAKSGLGSEATIAFVEAHIASDICLFSSQQHLSYFNFDVWEHGEHHHPGIVERAEALLRAAGHDWRLADAHRHGPSITCYSNYWVASENFWDAYVGGVLNPIAELIEREPENPAVTAAMEETDYLVSTPFLPFIVERLLTTFLARRPEFRVAAWQRDPLAACGYDFQREIVRYTRPIVDAADREEKFPAEVRDLLRMLSKLAILYEAEYLLNNPRSTGEIVPLRRSQRGPRTS